MYHLKILISHPRQYDRSSVIPLGVSVTLPRGIAFQVEQLVLRNVDRKNLSFQSNVLRRWPDGSIRWCRLEWEHFTACQTATETLTLEVCDTVGSFATRHSDLGQRDPATGGPSLPNIPLPTPLLFRVSLRDGDDNTWQFVAKTWQVIEDGPIFRRIQCQLAMDGQASGHCPLLFLCTVKYFPRLGTTVNRLRVCNPQAATHPGGTWDLGSQGSFFIRDLSIEYETPCASNPTSSWIQLSPSHEVRTATQSIQLFQASSGGDSWNSRNHVDRFGQVPMKFRGFELKLDDHCIPGDRATPRLGISDHRHQLTLCMRDYWENFPKCLTIDQQKLRLGLFPHESGYLHELQGGEQKTHQWAVSFQSMEEQEPLAWYHEPSLVTLNPESYAAAQAVPHLTPQAIDSHRDYLDLVDSAIQGTDTLASKRETIDQYGWRHFGDLYGDHEAVFHKSSAPLISHYNNQYDCVGAFAIQFMRSGRREWWEQMIAMADHVWDIDTYHTNRDKNLYNGGLFWHTYHYADADKATHRSYPSNLSQLRKMPGGKDLAELGHTGKRLKKTYAIGGGPSASHNYPTGWMHAFYLTGEPDYREAAISAADYVQRIEDGKKTIFHWLSHADTGLSIESSPGYQGPGRASGNSLHALLTGYELTDDLKYLKSAEELISRVIHPKDNIDNLDLTNAELRWFYTMFLQALMRYIDIKATTGGHDDAYAYAWGSLLHYARWMLIHESPTLDHPEKLQYPTETWAAQDMRKWHILQYVAWLDIGDTEERNRFQAKADFFFEYVCKTLKSMPTHRLCRPTVLMLHFGWQRTWFLDPENVSRHPRPLKWDHFPSRIPFVPQRTIAVRRAKKIMVATALLVTLLSLIVLARLLT